VRWLAVGDVFARWARWLVAVIGDEQRIFVCNSSLWWVLDYCLLTSSQLCWDWHSLNCGLPDLEIRLLRKVETKSNEVPLRAFGGQVLQLCDKGEVGTRKGLNLTPISSFICSELSPLRYPESQWCTSSWCTEMMFAFILTGDHSEHYRIVSSYCCVLYHMY